MKTQTTQTTQTKKKRSTRKEVEARLAEIVERHRQRTWRNSLALALAYRMPRSFTVRIRREAIARGFFADAREFASYFTAPGSRTWRWRCKSCHAVCGQERVAS